MCGIAGILNSKRAPVSLVTLKKMADSIAHRGPDGDGFYSEEGIGLAHRRLAILDLSNAASQPMSTEDGQFVLTYNGEIYNFQKLRSELQALGYQFNSQSDSEVVLNAFAEWREACVHKFNGMFAFAIWDKKNQRLFLARDRYGIKPLYFWSSGETFLFASEYKAILCHPGVKRALNTEVLAEYLTFQNIFTYRTLIKDIHVLPPGNYGYVAGNSSGTGNSKLEFKSTQYWDYNFQEPSKILDERECQEELDRLFVQSVQRQLVTDVELGAYLSGGIDSGSVTAIAAREYPYIKSFTCGFDLHSASGLELAYDERAKAEYMSYLFKTEHYEMVLKAGDMERVMSKLAFHIEDPRVGQSYPNFYAAQLASKFVKVVLSGTGGDEMFGGYPWRYYRAIVNNDFDDYIDKYYQFWQRLIPNSYLIKLLSPIAEETASVWTRDIFKDVFQHHSDQFSRPEDYVNHSMYFEAKTFLHGLLIVEDRLSMAHGLETRVPFLDNDLVDFASQLPVKYKLNSLSDVVKINENDTGPKGAKYFEKTRDGKRLLRNVMQKYLPDTIALAEKQGFSAPDASWFKGESIEYVRRILFSRNARIYKYLDREMAHAIMNEHFEGRQNRRLFIWSLLSLEHFLETFIS